MSKLWLAIPFLPLAPVVIGLSIITARAAGQEKPARQTHTWEAVYTQRGVHVEIVDTEGVCLYIATRTASVDPLAITAIPKTQLPAGTGCQ